MIIRLFYWILLVIFGALITNHVVESQELETFVPCGNSCLKVGFTYPNVTYQNEGKQLRNGYILWADYLNQKGGISTANGTFQIELVGFPDDSTPENVADLYRELITTVSVDFVLAPYGLMSSKQVSNVTWGNFPLIIQNDIEHVDEAQTSRVFSISTQTSQKVNSLRLLFEQMGVANVSIIGSSDSSSMNLANMIIQEMNQGSVSVLGNLFTFETGNLSQIQTAVNSLQDLNIDALISISSKEDAESVVTVVNDVNLRPRAFFLGATQINEEFIQNLPQSQAEYLLGFTQWTENVNYDDSFFGDSSNFTELYFNRFNEEPDFIAAGASATGYVLQLALGSASSISTEDVSMALMSINTTSFYGHIAFNENGINSNKPAVFTQVLGGMLEIVAPIDQKTNDLVYPIPWASNSTTPSPSNTPTPTPSPSNTPTPTPSPSNTPTPSPSDTPTPTPTPNPSNGSELFSFCQDIRTVITATICVDLSFEECSVILRIRINDDGDETVLLRQSFSISQFDEIFEENCFSGICQTCFGWDDVILNDTLASGCSYLVLDCIAIDPIRFSLGCFEDTDVVPRCFGGCPNDCSFRGICENNECNCDDGFYEEDCSRFGCLNDCSNQGRCIDGVCQCVNDFAGDDCSVFIGNDQDDDDSGSNDWLAPFLGVLIPVALIALVVVIYVIYKKKQKKETMLKFHSDHTVEVDYENQG